MSCRHMLFDQLATETEPQVQLFRDCESATYRLFVFPSCVDLTTSQLRALADALAVAVRDHEPFLDDEGDLRAP